MCYSYRFYIVVDNYTYGRRKTLIGVAETIFCL